MNPMKAIGQLGEMLKQINVRRSHLEGEIDRITENWTQLKRIGGAREDHAAELMYRLCSHLDGLSKFCDDCATQIARMKADPFGHEETA